MRVVQALHWLKDTLPVDGDRVRGRLGAILADPKYGHVISADLALGFSHLPTWMQEFLRDIPIFAQRLADLPLQRISEVSDGKTVLPGAGRGA